MTSTAPTLDLTLPMIASATGIELGSAQIIKYQGLGPWSPPGNSFVTQDEECLAGMAVVGATIAAGYAHRLAAMIEALARPAMTGGNGWARLSRFDAFEVGGGRRHMGWIDRAHLLATEGAPILRAHPGDALLVIADRRLALHGIHGTPRPRTLTPAGVPEGSLQPIGRLVDVKRGTDATLIEAEHELKGDDEAAWAELFACYADELETCVGLTQVNVSLAIRRACAACSVPARRRVRLPREAK